MDPSRLSRLLISCARSGATTRVVLAGDVDFANTGYLRSALLSAAGSTTTHETSNTSELVLDLSKVTFIDCSGIGALVGVRRTVVASGIGVRIAAASPQVDRLLMLFQLGIAFDYPPSDSYPPADVMSAEARRPWWRRYPVARILRPSDEAATYGRAA